MNLLRSAALLFCVCFSLDATQPTADPPKPAAPSANTAGATNSALSLAGPKSAPASVFGLPQQPAWLTDLSLGVKEGYDNNVFEVSGLGAPEKSSWITTVSPVVGVDFAPLVGRDSFLKAAAFGYAPDLAFYHNQTTENNDAHRFAQALKGMAGDFSFSLDNGFNFIDGSELAPIYAPPDDVRSSFATAAPRERRRQLQDRAKVILKYDQPSWFVRPNASLLYYDLMTYLKRETGYQNYADRYDVNGGVDVGYKLTPRLSATLGYRYGHQYQQQLPSTIDPLHLSSPSDYQRVLVGFEGTPWKWLTFSAVGGPDFRAYEPDSPTHTTPVDDLTPITYYGEASAQAAITARDRLTFKYRQWQWVSSLGKLPLFDSLYELAYRRQVTDNFSLELLGRIQSSDYTVGNAASSARNDWQYTTSLGVSWAIDPHVRLALAYSLDLGRNHQENIPLAAYRQFDHQLVSFGAQFAW